MAYDQCMFPLFRARFLGGAKPFCEASVTDKRDSGSAGLVGSMSLPIAGSSGLNVGPTKLGRLDLRSLAREDGQPTEVGARRQKMAAFEKKCSEVIDKLYISGEWVAKDAASIQRNRITHVINCVAALYPPFHEHMCTYKNLFLQGAQLEHRWLSATIRAHTSCGQLPRHCTTTYGIASMQTSQADFDFVELTKA